MDAIIKHIQIGADRASTNPEVSQAHSLAAIAMLMEQLVIESRRRNGG